MSTHHAIQHGGLAPAPAAAEPADLALPLAGFSQCHYGIAAQLQAFAELPGLLAAQAQARDIAARTLSLFKYAVAGHHADEEEELFPAVLRNVRRGEEAVRAQTMVLRLTAEHRRIDALWKALEPAVKAVANNRPAELDLVAAEALVQAYLAHARYEEEHFLPLAEEVLGRGGKHMAALGLTLHLRHAPMV